MSKLTFKNPDLVCMDCKRTVRRTSGSQKRCDECRDAKAKAHRSEWNKANPDYQKRYKRADYAADPGKYRARRRAAWAADKERHVEYHREWRQRNRAKINLQAKCRKFGMAMDDLLNLLARQEERCAICGRQLDMERASFTLDHCHATGQVRGAVHKKCNTGIGMFEDDPEIVQRAADYLRRHATETVSPAA
jgi:hypothetical protein